MSQATINTDASSSYSIQKTDAAYATARGAATGTSLNGGFVGSELSGTYSIYRHFMKFDLSTIPTNATITALDFKCYFTSRDTNNDFTVVTSAHTAPNTTLTTAEFDALTVDSPTEYSARSANASVISLNTYTTFSLNATAIAAAQALLGGATYFKVACRSSRDVDNSTPTLRSYISLDAGDGSNPPQLVVTYDVPSAGGIIII